MAVTQEPRGFLPLQDDGSNKSIRKNSLIAPDPDTPLWKTVLKSLFALFARPSEMGGYVFGFCVAKFIDMAHVHFKRFRSGGPINEQHHSPFAQDMAGFFSGRAESLLVTTFAAPIVSAFRNGMAAYQNNDFGIGNSYDCPEGYSRIKNRTDVPQIPDVVNNRELEQQISEFLMPTTVTPIGAAPVVGPVAGQGGGVVI